MNKLPPFHCLFSAGSLLGIGFTIAEATAAEGTAPAPSVTLPGAELVEPLSQMDLATRAFAAGSLSTMTLMFLCLMCAIVIKRGRQRRAVCDTHDPDATAESLDAHDDETSLHQDAFCDVNPSHTTDDAAEVSSAEETQCGKMANDAVLSTWDSPADAGGMDLDGDIATSDAPLQSDHADDAWHHASEATDVQQDETTKRNIFGDTI